MSLGTKIPKVVRIAAKVALGLLLFALFEWPATRMDLLVYLGLFAALVIVMILVGWLEYHDWDAPPDQESRTKNP